jgi:hypothetical protein
MTTPELRDILTSEAAFFASLPDVQEVLLYGSALLEKEIAGDIDLLVIPAREMSEGGKVELRQAIWERLKIKMPVMLEVVTPTADLSKDAFAARKIPSESIYRR